MSSDLRQARLLWEVDVDGFGGDELFVTDLNGDGEPELLMRQSAGGGRAEFVFRRFGPRGMYTEEERHLNCISAVDLKGNLLWQVGEAHQGEHPYFCHGSAGFAFACLEGDALPDVLAVVWDVLTVLDGRSGAVKAELKVPTDNFNTIVSVNLRGDPTRQQLLVKAGGRAYPPYRPGNPTFVLDSDLSELWGETDYPCVGCRPVVLDLDNDGCEEILVGSCLVDHDGQRLWTLLGVDPEKEHVDHVNPVGLKGDGQIQLAYAVDGGDFLLVDTQGEEIWRREHRHSQSSIAGRFRSDVEGLAIVLTEKWIGMTCYTPEGHRLWNKEGVGYGRRTVLGWGEDGLDLILYEPHLLKGRDACPYHSVPEETRNFWPYLIDGEGNRVMELPWKEDYVQPRQLIRGFRAYDYGIVFHNQVMDLDGDGRDEVVVWDRRRVMAFGAPD